MKYFFFTIKDGAITSNNLSPAADPEMYEPLKQDGKEHIYYIIMESRIANIMCEADSLIAAANAVELFLSRPMKGITQNQKRPHRNAAL